MKSKFNFLGILLLMSAMFIACDEEVTLDIAEKDGTTQVSETDLALKAGECGTSSIHYGDYWLNNNDWGSSNDGFGYQCVWLYDQNSWGAYCTHLGSNSSGIKGYPSIVYGKQGDVETNDYLPKAISELGDVRTWWSWSGSGNAWNAAYDLWFNESDYELMLWMQWENSWPMGNSLGVVYENITLSGYNWDVYKKNNIFSFLLVEQQGWISLDLKPVIDFCVSEGWIPSSAELYRIEAGWEVINGGDFKTKSFGISSID